MDAKEIIEYQRKLIGDPENGTEPELSLDQLEAENPEHYATLKPMLMGMEPWPEYTPPAEPAVEPAVEPEPEPAAEPEPAPRDVDAPAVVEARDRLTMRQAALDAYNAKVADLQAVLDKPEPDDEFSEEHKDWRKEQRQATLGLTAANREYIIARDTADDEVHRTVVQKSEFSDTIRSLGDSFEELKLPRAYDAMVGDYNAWAARAMQAAETDDIQKAFQKFQSDPEFAKRVGPLPEGHETLFIYMHAVEAQKQKGGPLDGHVLSLAAREGVFKNSKARTAAAAARTGAERSAEALQQRSTEPRPAAVRGGTQEAPVAIIAPTQYTTEEQDMAWLQDYNLRLDKERAGVRRSASEIERDTHHRDIVMDKWSGKRARSFA